MEIQHLPNGWNIKKLGDIFDFLKTESLSREQLTYEQTESNIKYIHYGDIHVAYKNQILDIKNTQNIPLIKDEIDISKIKSWLKEGDLIIADASEDYEGTGACIELKNVGNEKVIGGLHTIAIRDIANETVLGFRGYLFKNPFVSIKMKQMVTGFSVYGISKTNLSNLEIILPKKEEQKKIAQILSTWDEAIQTTQSLIKKLEIRKKGLMQKVLDSKTKVEIEQIATDLSIRNKANKALTVLSCTKYDGLVASLEYFGRRIYSEDISTYKVVPKNTFAYATNHIEEGSIGYQSKYNEALISPMYTVFQTNELINDEYLFFVLKSDKYIKIYQQNMTGSIDRRGALRWADFSKLKIPFPPIEEQTAIAKILNTADAELNETKAYLETLKQQKKGLMQQLLTGKIRVK